MSNLIFRVKTEQRKKERVVEGYRNIYQWTKVILVQRQRDEATAEDRLEPEVSIQREK